MQKIIKKGNSLFILIPVFALLTVTGKCFSQVAVSGPVCVMMGTTYSYPITGTYYSSSTMQICVKGGVLAGTPDSCSGNTVPVAVAGVTWNTPGPGKLIITSSSGNTSMDVNVISPLQAGDILPATATQSIKYNTNATLIDCSAASGGNCSPVYVYEWQVSDNNLLWRAITGGTGKSIILGSPQKKTVYLRRKVTETISGTIAYSGSATILVDVDRTGHN